MAEKEGLSLSNHCQGRKKEQRAPVSRSQSLPWQRCSLGAQVAPQRCPILRSSVAILPCWFVFAGGRFFNVKMVGFSS
jgi:hypothetical protein